METQRLVVPEGVEGASHVTPELVDTKIPPLKEVPSDEEATELQLCAGALVAGQVTPPFLEMRSCPPG
jgi:hypothetical protein